MTNEVTQKTTSNEQNVSSSNGLEPLLRFCEFKGNLPQVKLSELFHKCTQKNRNGAINNVICNSAKNGLIPQRDFFDKDIANSENTTGYYIIKNNDFVYNPRKSNEAPYGPVSIYKDAEDGIVSPLYLCFRATAPLCAEYFKMYFKSPAWHRYVYLMGDSGARHDRVSIKDEVFFDMPVRTPSLSEQQKIADFLSLVDARIEKQRLLVESLKKYKRGLLSAIFDRKLRFKDENGNDYPEWENKKISDIFKLTRGYVLATSEISELQTSEFKYPVYSSQTKNEGLLGYYNKYLYKNAITWTTDGANAGYVKFRNGEFYCTNVCGVLLCNKGNCNSYIAEKLNSVTKRHVSYVGNPKLMNNVMAEIYIDFPSIQEQKRNSKLLTKIDEKIKTSNFLYDRLILLKQGLLQQMFI